MPDLPSDETPYGLSPFWRRCIVIFPVILMILFWIPLMIPRTQDFTIAMLEENRAVQLFTFELALLGGILGLRLAWRTTVAGVKKVVPLFYLLFSLGLFVLAGEEVAWGQKIMYYRTPEFIEKINYQNEMTLHNLQGWRAKNRVLRLGVGLAGLVAIKLSSLKLWWMIGSPPVLFSWFLLISLKGGLDFYVRKFPIAPMFDYSVNRMSEIIELMVAIAAVLYIWLNGRRLFAQSQKDRELGG